MSRMATIRRRKGGFTLIEIMIVVLIIGILLAIAIPNFMRARESSRARSCVANLKQIETAKEQWAMDNKKVDGDDPGGLAVLAPTYIKQTPECPSNGAYTPQPVGTNAICSKGGVVGAYDYHGL